MDNLPVIGQTENVMFPEFCAGTVPARIDTGAQTSSIWASHVELKNGKLEVVFFDKLHPFYTGEAHIFKDFEEVVVRSSNGTRESRYKIKLLVEIEGRRIRARFTLADRSTQEYPVLVGRNVLYGKFVVNVKRNNTKSDNQKLSF